MTRNALVSMVYPVLAAGVVLGLIASNNALNAPPLKDDFSLVGEQSPWHSEWVLALSDCTACSVKTLDLPQIERKIGSKTLLLAMNRNDVPRLRRGKWIDVQSQIPGSDFGARFVAIVPRLLRLGPDGKVLEDATGVQTIWAAITEAKP